jgi:hypothetical protein
MNVIETILGDDEPSTPAQPLEDKSAEIGNLHNHLNSTNQSLDTVKDECADIEQRLAEQAGAVTLTEGLTIRHDILKPSSPDILAAAIAQPLPNTPRGSVVSSPSPQPSLIKSTNPFKRRTTTSPPPSQSPFMPFSSTTEPLAPTQPKDDSNAEVDLDDPFGLGTSQVGAPTH